MQENPYEKVLDLYKKDLDKGRIFLYENMKILMRKNPLLRHKNYTFTKDDILSEAFLIWDGILLRKDIPDEKKVDTPTGTNYLEEKGLMGALAVQDFVDAFRKKYPEKADQFEATVWSNTAPRHWEAEWWEIYTYLEDALWSPKAASKFLEEMGYDGIHYVGRRDWDAYVVFKDENMDIKNHIRYKKDANWLTKKDYSDNWLRYKKAWHWSPADFDRFDSSHMGEWEWAQAHGWGHYVAVNKKTWEYYAQGKWEYKYNWDNEHFIASNHKLVLDIQRTARKHLNAYQKQVAEAINGKKLFVSQSKVNEALADLLRKFKYYRLTMHTFSMASFIEVMLSGDFKEENIRLVKKELEKLSANYRDLFSECSVYLEKLSDSSVETNVLKGLGAASKAVGRFIDSIPKIREGQVDEFLLESGSKMQSNADRIERKVIESFAEISNPGVWVFVEKLNDMIQIYSRTTEIYFDEKHIYLIAG